MTPRGYFVTGTDTGVGKTRVAVALCHSFRNRGLRTAAMKPIASGGVATAAGLRNDDALSLQAASNLGANYADVNPYCFEPAIAPHIAAQDAGVSIDFEWLDRRFERLQMGCDVIIVEGAGGWLTPLDQGRSFADIALRWHLQVILVVGLRLGCLNHALLTAEAIERRGLSLTGWVPNAFEPRVERAEDMFACLHERLHAPCIGLLPFCPDEPAAQSALRMNTELLLAAGR